MPLPDGDDDEAFLLAVDAAEAAALEYTKRRRLSTSSSPTAATPPAASDGSYLAALKGSHSSAWKQKQENLTHAHKRPGGSTVSATTPTGGSGGAQAASGACFRCGDSGHWARDCPQSGPASGYGGGGGGGGGTFGAVGSGGFVDAGAAVEEKACPCGAGSCLVLTSNTTRNPGRKFYKCPMRDNGGCNFFEWCDAPSPGHGNARGNTVFQPDTSLADMLCPCGAGTCVVLTTKTGKNVGRQFYRCPANQGGSSCGFFKWCDDPQLRPTSAPRLQAPSSYHHQGGDVQNPGKPRGSPSSCFKCGQENHWARDCPNHHQASDPYPDSKGGGRVPLAPAPASSPDACFKCGKSGHWSRDCPAAGCGAAGGGTVASHAHAHVESSSTWSRHRY